LAEHLYEKVCKLLSDKGLSVASGVFGQHMHVATVNDGPVTFLLDTKRLF
jgi:D-tyrosyl-tRNA(Tyr) deacylase